ncbi:hypothetical protein FRC17_002134 [Serendipita sp. 399]|nr:hypothetical protein FRC17_002134 [Serendipita sp. 399]
MAMNNSKSMVLQFNNDARLNAAIPSPTIQIRLHSPTSSETGGTRQKVDVDLVAPILQHIHSDMEEDDGRSGSPNSSSLGSHATDPIRRSLDSRLASNAVRTDANLLSRPTIPFTSQQSTDEASRKSPSSPNAELLASDLPKAQQRITESTISPTSDLPTQSKSNASEDDGSGTLKGASSRLNRPQKPNLSIPIPPLPSKTTATHTRAATSAQLTSSPTSATNDVPLLLTPHSRSATTPRSPPSPGHSLRLTPSIVMSRPAWPLPPLPPMPTLSTTIPTTTASPSSSNDRSPNSFTGDIAAADGSDKGHRTISSLFRLSPPIRSMTGPAPSSPSTARGEDSDSRVRRSASVNLDSMPSLNVMGELEVGDPEADDYDMDEGDEDGEENNTTPSVEVERVGRPSIDSVLSMDSIASTDTVRAPVQVVVDSPSSSAFVSGVVDRQPPSTDVKGKGKARAPSLDPEVEVEGEAQEEGGSGSDSDDSLYFDARDSILLSSKEVTKALERRESQRRSQIYGHNQMPSSAFSESVRERRLSSWSISTGGGRESVYLTPMEGMSAFMTPSGQPSRWETAQTDSQFAHHVNAAFLSGAGDKRASVPAGFGLPSSSLATGGVSGSGISGLNTKRGGENRNSMSRLSQGSRAMDLSTLKFDPSSFRSEMLSHNGSIRRNISTGGSGSALPDGLPPSRREGLPNFEAARPYTVESEKARESSTHSAVDEDPRTPHASDYFSTRTRYGVHGSSPSNHRRRGSISASVLVPAVITEDVLAADAPSAVAPGSLKSAPMASPSSASQQKTPVSMQPASVSPVVGTIKGMKRPSVYRQASRSMVDLSISSIGMGLDDEDEKDSNQKISLDFAIEVSNMAPPTATPVDNMAWLVPPPSPVLTRPSLAKRQSTIRRVSSFPLLQSMDMPGGPFEKPPPTYESIPRREEEGREVLPCYSNDIILAALVHKKVEFDRPGVQARDRRWHRVWCVLHGTMFRVYKVGTLEVKFGALSAAPVAGALPTTSASTILSSGRARQATVSTSGRTSGSGVTGQTIAGSEPAEGSTASWKAPLNDTSPHVGSVLTRNQQLGAPNLTPPFNGSPNSPSPSTTSGRSSGSSHTPSRASHSYSRSTSPRTSIAAGLTQSHLSFANTCPSPQITGHGPNGRSLMDNGGTDIYSPSQSALMRQYTLQNAESGLATDYVKRRNVIRLRLEGEQFLMQLANVEEVVSWIEGFQAAANIALELDTRLMPKGPIYPRRRRRRRVREPGELPTQSPLSASNAVPPATITTTDRSSS